jgi:glycogen synthase
MRLYRWTSGYTGTLLTTHLVNCHLMHLGFIGAQGTDPMALDYALNRALDTYYNDRQWFNKLAKRVMLQDWSWARPALDYIELYYQVGCGTCS